MEKSECSGEINELTLIDEKNIAWQTIRWKNRRRMAWCSVWALLSIILLFFFAPISDTRLSIIVEPISLMAFVFGGVIASYMGFTAMEKWKMGK